MANTLETKEVTRNGETFDFVKTQQSGENSRPNWKIVIKPEDLGDSKLSRWMGENGNLLIENGFVRVFSIWYHHTKLGTNDDLFFKRFEEGKVLQGARNGGSKSKQAQKIDALSIKLEKAKQKMRDQGKTEEEIDDLFA